MAAHCRTLVLALWGAGLLAAQAPDAGGAWTPMFDGKTLKGWKETPFTERGPVQVSDGIIRLGRGYLTGIHWAGKFPKSGYEIRFEAARLEGRDFFAGITFPVNDSFCTWINGGWGGSMVGLSSLDDMDASENETSTSREFTNGRWYRFWLVVTENRIRGWIDEQQVIDADLQGRRVGLRPGEIELSVPIGFASYSTVAGLRKIEYRLLRARGI